MILKNKLKGIFNATMDKWFTKKDIKSAVTSLKKLIVDKTDEKGLISSKYVQESINYVFQDVGKITKEEVDNIDAEEHAEFYNQIFA